MIHPQNSELIKKKPRNGQRHIRLGPKRFYKRKTLSLSSVSYHFRHIVYIKYEVRTSFQNPKIKARGVL